MTTDDLILLALLVVVGIVLPVHRAVEVSLAAKQFSVQSARDAEMFFHWSTHLPLALGNLVSGVLVVMPNPGRGMFGAQSSTKPIFYLGCAFGVLGLLCQWFAIGIVALIVSNVLFGAMQALCGSALLFVLMDRWKDTKAAAVGACLGSLAFAELFGSTFAVLAIDRGATCTRDGQPASNEDCDAQFLYAADADATATAAVAACECKGFRPGGPLVVGGCLVVCLLGGLYYTECYLGPKPRSPRSAQGGKQQQQQQQAESPNPSAAQAAGGLKYGLNSRDQLAWTMQPATTAKQLIRLASVGDPVLRACVAMMLCGGTIQGALFAAVNSLHHHDSSHGLDDQITGEEEKLLHGTYSLVVLLVAPIAGRSSDHLNRKVFVVAGVMIMVLGSLVCASAVSYASDTAQRLAELFLTALLHGLGTAAMYGATVAAVAERALSGWRPLAVAVARSWWEVGRLLGYLIIDPIVRGSELTGLCLVSLSAFVVGLYWILVFKDERAELGAQEDRPELATVQPLDDDDIEAEEQAPAAAP
jgi:MFS family permease